MSKTIRYQLENELGAGGMGRVYRAYDRLTQQYIALKQITLHPEDLVFASRLASAPTNNLLLTLAQEFRILASLHHPHIIRVLDYGFETEKRQPYFTMELLEPSQTILQASRGRTLAAQIDLLLQMLYALSYLHRRKIMHCDLKPENVLVSGEHLRVLDFGLSVTHEQIKNVRGAGTLLYMAPEVFLGQSVSPASDLYAVGVIAYEILVGRHPFYRGDFDSFVEQWLNAEADLTAFADYGRLESVVNRLLARQVESRYQQADEVIVDLCAALGRVVPDTSIAIRESFLQAATFVGRDEELAGLTIALAATQRGHGSAWLVGGESGVGKSRLLDELRIRALVEGALVLRGQAVEGASLPYQLWREPLRRLVLTSELSDLEASILKPIIPDIASLLGREILNAPDLEGQAAQQRLHLTIIDLFKQQTQPVLLLLEDLQWSNEGLLLFRSLLGLVKELPLLIVGSYRDDEHPNLPTILSPTIFSEAQMVKLQRLGQPAIAELSAIMLGDIGRQPQVIEFFQQETEGNAFFMVEYGRTLAEEVRPQSLLEQISQLHQLLPGGVKHLLRRRLGQVPGWAQPSLKLAAIAGRQLDRQVLTTAQPNLHWEHWLVTCFHASIFDSVDGQWRFAHDKLRETVLADLTKDELSQLHRRIAEALESTYPQDVAYAEPLANHWENAGEAAKAIPYLVQAIEHLVNLTVDYIRAEALIARGLALSKSSHQAILLYLWGECRYYLSDFGAAATHYTACLEASTLDPVLQLRVRNGLSRVLWRQRSFAEAAAFTQQTLADARAKDDQSIVAESLYNLGWITFLEGDYLLATAYLEEGLAICRVQHDRRGIANMLGRLAGVFYQLGQYAVARHHLEESLLIRREISDRFGIASGLANLGAILGAQGHHEENRRCCLESLALFRAMGNQNSVAHTLNNLGCAALDMGDFTMARDYFAESLQLDQKIGDPIGLARNHDYLGIIAYFFGDDQLALRHLAESLQIRRASGEYPGIVMVQSARVFPLLRSGEQATAQAVLAEALELARDLAAPQQVYTLLAAAYLAQCLGQNALAAAWLGLVERDNLLKGGTNLLRKNLAQILEQALGTESYAVAIASGRTLELATTLRAALTQLQ